MARIYIVPGVAASTLWSGPLMRWAVYSDIALGRFGVLVLADDGVSPGDGGQLLTTSDENRLGSYFGFLPGYYDALHKYLEAKVAPLGHDVACYPYDWRLRNTTSGRNLALRIIQDVDAADPCYLVCHSMGGILARMCWYHLGLMGKQNLVKRIVTLGTPHQGAYSVLWEMNVGAQGNSTTSMYRINFLFGVVPKVPVKPVINKSWKPDEYVQLLWSWPSTYELMPQLGGSENASDLEREHLYGSSNYEVDYEPHDDHLTYARDTFQPLFQSAPCLPPREVMVTVAGYGFDTKDKTINWNNMVRNDSFGSTTNGDQTVVVPSAIIATHYAPLVSAKHSDLPTACATDDRIYAWLFDPIPTDPNAGKLVGSAYINTAQPNLPWPPLPVGTPSNVGSISNPTMYWDP